MTQFATTLARTLTGALLASSLAACGGSKPEDAATTSAAETPAAEMSAAAPSAEAVPAAASSSAAPSAAVTSAAAPAVAAAPAAAAPAVAIVAEPAAFGICKACHAVEKGKSLIGPSLFAIAGTRAGDVAGYSFSPALKASGLKWDDATLDKWLENPMKLVPGTRMTYAGQADPEKRKAIIAYIKTLK